MSKDKKIYTIAASQPFLEVLANKLYQQYKNKPEDLAKVVLLLPTRRACRSFQEIILNLSNGLPLILPKLFPISDIDPYELSFNLVKFDIQKLSDPMPAIKRQIYLVQLVQKTHPNMPYEQAFSLSQALAHLLDQIHTENLKLQDLEHIVDEAEFSKHWQITINFLSIIGKAWPAILQEENLIDPAEYRNQFLLQISEYWLDNPPDYPVIFAGSTGTIPAVRQLMKTILSFKQGSVILPGLDKIMTPAQWDNIEEGHPQAALKALINFLEVKREDISFYETSTPYAINKHRELIASHLNFPNDTYDCDIQGVKSELKNITLYECETLQEEALTISLILREALEDEKKTVALVTPNRKLAKRVQQICLRWGIEIDDTAGSDLGESEIGKFLTALSKFLASDFDPVCLLSLLKHSFIQNPFIKEHLSKFEILLIRGVKNYKNFDDLMNKYSVLEPHIIKKYDPNSEMPEFIQNLAAILNPFLSSFSNELKPAKDCLRDHIKLAEILSNDTLWQKDYAEEASDLISKIDIHIETLPNISGREYDEVFSSLINSVTTRPKYGTNSRVHIYGLLEARMIHSDSIIMGGLNEAMWPAEAGYDPWMSRPMRKKYGLPSPERGITLSAHDFTMAFCQAEVFMTRSKREDGTPTVPSRWLQKLNVFLQSIELSFDDFNQGEHLNYSKFIDQTDSVETIKRPEPRPALEARPKKLSATKIDMWRNDPYGLYANKILNLYALNPIKLHVDVAERGIILHEILQIFNEQYRKNIPDNAGDEFLKIAKDIIVEKYKSEPLWLSWKSRLISIAEEYINFEKEWRTHAHLDKTEEKIECFLKDHNFTLEARIDRIDLLNNSSKAIIDYKSGGQYTKSKILTGTTAQLPLEALILKENSQETSYLGYWKITGAKQAMEVTEIDDPTKILETIKTVSDGLSNLIATFADENTPYYALPNPNNAPRFNDYAYLERIKEWIVLDDEEAA